MMTDLIKVAMEWLASTGAPNWLVLLALLTSPWTWTNAIRERVKPLLDKYLPAQ